MPTRSHLPVRSARALLRCAAGAIVILGSLGVGPALAQRDDPALQQACSQDYFRLCSDKDPNGPEVEQCFNQNRRNLSPACRTAIDTFERGSRGTTSPRR